MGNAVDIAEHAARRTPTSIAVAYLGLGPMIGSLVVSAGMWAVMLGVAGPVGIAVAYYAGGPSCLCAFAASVALRRLGSNVRLPMLALIGGVASYATGAVLGMGGGDSHLTVLMGLAGAPSTMICESVAGRMNRPVRTLAMVWIPIAAWCLAWTILVFVVMPATR